ncbi:hypothetical protein F5Y14DRAFT_423346 [Nemania sp. NC0429]|nr:hypothetical protein F5Y14DRAFT_423346 [Nemania sp. NC0429]
MTSSLESFPLKFRYADMPEYKRYAELDTRPTGLPPFELEGNTCFIPVGECFCRVAVDTDDDGLPILCGRTTNIRKAGANNFIRHIETHTIPGSATHLSVPSTMGGPDAHTRLATCKYWRKLDAWITDPTQNEIPTVPRRARKPGKQQWEDIPWHHPPHHRSGKKIPNLSKMRAIARTPKVCKNCKAAKLDTCSPIRTPGCLMWAKFKKSTREQWGELYHSNPEAWGDVQFTPTRSTPQTHAHEEEDTNVSSEPAVEERRIECVQCQAYYAEQREGGDNEGRDDE